MKVTKLIPVGVITLGLLLSACGGGGGDDSSTTSGTQNLAPVVTDVSKTLYNNTTLSITLPATDNNNTLKYEIVNEPSQGTVRFINSVATYTLSNDYNGVDSFTFRTYNDLGTSNTATVSINVIKKISVIGNNITYEGVISPLTGKIWLDRNLGATKICQSESDTTCYGDYYQWGRKADGHENNVSSTTTTLADSFDLNASFIISSSSGNGDFISFTRYDWTKNGLDSNGSKRSQYWNESNGTSICPIGFRVPTVDELNAEDFNNSTDALTSFLKLPTSGYRKNTGVDIVNSTTTGNYWSTTVPADTKYTVSLEYGQSSVKVTSKGYLRNEGLSVRCIKN